MRPLRILLIMAALWAPPALACTLGPDHEKWEREYYNAVTSVYVAVAEDFDPEDPRYPSDNFSVLLRPVEVVWGAAPAPQPLKLEYTAGACDEWFLWGNDYNEPLDGRRYLVFVALCAVLGGYAILLLAVWMSVDKRRQGPHDRLAGTLVILRVPAQPQAEAVDGLKPVA